MIPGDAVPGMTLLRDPRMNRGTAFSSADRLHLGLAGLLPPRVETIAEQSARVLENVRARTEPIEKYLYLSALQGENETLFYRVVLDNLQELLPIVYTPTVGQACQEWSRRYFGARGLYLTPEHRGHIVDVLAQWPRRDVAIIVVTDGGRILGLGDLGMNGMGIPIGKLALYTVCAGVAPDRCLPVTLDVGTDTESLRNDPFYLGRRAPRLSGERYDALVEEFVAATQAVFPHAVLQFEDFNNANAFRLLDRYRERLCCFNDDVQGTGAMGLAGLYSAGRITGRGLPEERLLFVGAGEACLGIGAAVVAAMQDAGVPEAEARSHCLFVDSQGLVVSGRTDLAPHKRAVARELAPCASLEQVIGQFRPTVMIGASGQPGIFTPAVLQAIARVSERPVVFALSNPTSKSECTAEAAYRATRGNVLFASGSPFGPVELEGRSYTPGQANNSYVFPGLGLGLIVSKSKRVTDRMFLAAARALSSTVSGQDLEAGRVYPPQSRMREVAVAVASAVTGAAFADGVAGTPPCDPVKLVREAMYWPKYD